MQHMTKEQRAVRDADFAQRLEPTMLWPSQHEGPAIRTDRGYRHKPVIRKKSKARKLTEAEDNAIGRALRRRQNKAARGWLPHAKR